MTKEQRDLIRKLWWLCGDFRAGNSFSNEQLWEWEQQAQTELARTRPLRPDEEAQARHDRWDDAYARAMAMMHGE